MEALITIIAAIFGLAFFVYVGYLIITKAFKDMGFSAFEAIIIVFLCFILGSGFIDGLFGINYSNIPLFTYHTYWQVGINVGGAIIPLIISAYLLIKNKLPILKIFIGIGCVAVITYFVTFPDPSKGIVAVFPYWLLPILLASFLSLLLCWKKKRTAAPFAYIISTLGVLLGADCFHLIPLLNNPITTTTPAIIGGAHVFDMVFLAGIFAVIVDSIFFFQEKKG